MDTDQTNDDVANPTTNDQVDESSAVGTQNNKLQVPTGQTKKGSAGAIRQQQYDQKRGPPKFQHNQRFKRIDPRRNLAHNAPTRNYNHVQAEMYGSGCKGKKFRKEKGKKKRSQYSGAVIDGSVRSVRLDT